MRVDARENLRTDKEAKQMTAELSAGAVSRRSTDWHAIPWRTVNEMVRRLQARIVQATQAGKSHEVQPFNAC